ncbi:MAG: hypothetical protein NZL93_00960, partial [Chthoniobacterales bacterium]|nr:hypothetical protein [Chthoniobacterales bacterium]
QRLVEGTNEAIIRAGANLISFDFGRVVFVTKRVDGTYPNYRQVIPSQMNYRARLERELFLECVHRVSLMGADGFHAVRLNFSKDLLEIQLNAPDVGEAQETLATAFNGEGMRICFSPEFLMDPLRNMEEEEIDLELIDSLSPGVIKPVNDKLNERFLYVLMPMNPDGVRV